MNEEILNRLEEKGLTANEALDVLNICNEYFDKRKRQFKIDAAKSFAKLIQRYFQAKDQNLSDYKKLDGQVRRTIKQILK